MERLKFKVVIMGAPQERTDALLNKYVESFFRESYSNTIGVAFLTKDTKCKTEKGDCFSVVFQLWHVKSNSIFSSIRKNYIKGGQGAIIVFDSSEPETILDAINCSREICETIGDRVPFLIIDLKKELSFSEGKLSFRNRRYFKKLVKRKRGIISVLNLDDKQKFELLLRKFACRLIESLLKVSS
jgi:GTPase SAR1 family protein